MEHGDTWWESFFAGAWGELQSAGYPEERTRAEVDFIVQALELTPGARVLDVPCGAGRHSIELAARGFAPTGIDFNPKALAAARNAARARSLELELLQADMRSFTCQAPFDAAICFFGSFGYFSDDENLMFAGRVARALAPGGRFLIDTHVTESLFPRFAPRAWSFAQDPPGSERVLEDRRFELESRRIVTEWTFVRPQGIASAVSSIRLYGYGELCDLLRTVGFRTFRGFESGSMKPFALGSRRLGLVAGL